MREDLKMKTEGTWTDRIIGHLDLDEKYTAMIRSAVKTARTIIEEKDSSDEEPMMPVFLYLKDDNNLGIVGTPYSSDAEKEAVAIEIKKIFAEERAVACIHVCEVWRKTFDKGTSRDDMRPAGEYPDREEILMFFCECVGQPFVSLSAPMIRTGNKVALGDIVNDEMVSAEGRFVNLLPARNIH